MHLLRQERQCNPNSITILFGDQKTTRRWFFVAIFEFRIHSHTFYLRVRDRKLNIRVLLP